MSLFGSQKLKTSTMKFIDESKLLKLRHIEEIERIKAEVKEIKLKLKNANLLY